MDNNLQPLFFIHIMDGYSFRNMIAVIKSETDYATMVLSKQLIEFSFMNSNKSAIHKIALYPRDFVTYTYNVCDDEGVLVPECPIAFETSQMFNTTKNIGRKDSIRLYWLPEDNQIYVQPLKTAVKDPGRAGALFVKIMSMEHVRYDIGAWGEEANVKIQAKDFAEICTQANTMKCTWLELIGQDAGVVIKGILPNQTMAFVNRFASQTHPTQSSSAPSSNLPEIDDILRNLKNSNPAPGGNSGGLSLKIVSNNDARTIRVPISTVKALSKIHNIGPPNSLIHFYFSGGRVSNTKLECHIGNYGKYTICLLKNSS
jgi:hypothetical protein